jgi:hypothetical protein
MTSPQPLSKGEGPEPSTVEGFIESIQIFPDNSEKKLTSYFMVVAYLNCDPRRVDKWRSPGRKNEPPKFVSLRTTKIKA